MRKRLDIVAFLVLQFALVLPCLAQFRAFIPPKYKDSILAAPVSHYPEAARSHFTLGAQGVYRLKINPRTGEVDEVGILKHATQKLDSTVVLDFFKWRFKPGAFKQIDIPVVFDREIRVELKNAVHR